LFSTEKIFPAENRRNTRADFHSAPFAALCQDLYDFATGSARAFCSLRSEIFSARQGKIHAARTLRRFIFNCYCSYFLSCSDARAVRAAGKRGSVARNIAICFSILIERPAC
jgi:hypothetical protein